MKQVFVVVAYTAGYGTTEDRVVAVYPSRGQAEEHARLAETYCRERGRLPGNPYDPAADSRERWNTYSVYEVPFARHVDEFLEQVPSPSPVPHHPKSDGETVPTLPDAG